MENFEFLSPTRIVFGKGVIANTGKQVQAAGAKKVLLHYGGGSVKKYGVYDRVIASLKEAGISFVELGGVMPNPRLSLVYEGINLCRREGVDFILALGGGSAIDSSKAIAAGVMVDFDVWDFYDRKAVVKTALPLGVVLTIPAAGSEASNSSVITNEEKKLKRGLGSDIYRPVFAIMDPEVTYTLPPYQTLCGVSDIMAHIMERYFTNTQNVELTDRLCEAALKTLIHNLPIALANPNNYAARAEIMWAGTLAHNDLLSTGRVGDWASHMIEHELSAEYDVAHGAGLSVVFPAWMKYNYKHDIGRFVKFAMRVWDVEYDNDNPERTALEGIYRLESFYKRCGLPVRLPELGIGNEKLELMADKAVALPGLLGNFVKLNRDDVLAIYKLAL